MEIFVKALPVEEIIESLSKQLNTPIQRDGGELIIDLPEKWGKGFIRGTSFNWGIGVIEYNVTFFKDVEIHFTINQTHPLKFIFCSEGRVRHGFEENDDVHNIDTYQNVIVSSSGHNGHVLLFKANETSHVFSLEIIREEFNQRKNFDYKDMDPQLQRLFQDNNAEELFFYQGNYSIQAADIVESIAHKEHTGFLRLIFLEAKVYEMLAKQISQFTDDQQNGHKAILLRRSDVEKVKNAVEIINRDLNQNYSVDHLAKEVGTNVNKLQEGFKYMFDLTVNKYIQQVKLEAAKELLTESDHNISQIVGQIGLNNRSYFSKIFKEKYGVSPKYFLNHKFPDSENNGDSEED
ncbi:helix-turn-helix domain-containing protein [Salinimicrobium sediminilitoris]|uniref:helix-turn-helix domain-containing protein n=1 Tax=Salinimicrobium sediminilitoris TaxID=2876715 RepID=UPI001E4B4265|nr:AraC family transcriptional regulator [Salinimicrobium sediminilitoris]MCC8358884.1 AraC family transcriptional regulator [Salinimicrobium sediminilitoris]